VSKQNLLVIPQNGFAPSNESIANHLREQADWIEQADEGVRNVFMIVERADGSIYQQSMGQPCDLARTIGVMQMAIIRSALGEEE